MPRYFTVEEARSALDLVRPMMEEIQSIRRDILAHQPEVWPMIEKSAGNGGNLAASKLVRSFERLDELVHQLQDTGAILKDLNQGLIDFPAMREGHEVYLCWKYGESELAFWHEIDAGFSGRRSLDVF